MSEANEPIDEELHRYLDDLLDPEAAAAFEARMEADEDLARSVATLQMARDVLREDIQARVQAVDLSGFHAAVMQEIAEVEVKAPAPPPREPVPEEPTGLKGWWQRWWTPLVVSGAAAAVIGALLLAGRGQPADGDEPELTNGAVAVDAIENEGTKTILVSQPAEDGEATVIWMLDEEDEGPDAPAPGEDPI